MVYFMGLDAIKINMISYCFRSDSGAGIESIVESCGLALKEGENA